MLTLPTLAVINNAASPVRGGLDNTAFEALLGTPNLNGIAWLLIQHYPDLGKKTIGSATVFSTDGSKGKREINVLVELVKAPGN